MRAKFAAVFMLVMCLAITAHAAGTKRFSIGSALSTTRAATTTPLPSTPTASSPVTTSPVASSPVASSPVASTDQPPSAAPSVQASATQPLSVTPNQSPVQSTISISSSTQAPSSSASPDPTTQTAQAAPAQKGVASAKFVWHDIPKLTALDVSWAYGWSPWVPASRPGLDSVPMIATASDATDMVMRSLKRSAAAGQYTSLLGFNEPDNVNQANMTPEQAIALWPKLESTGLRLGSPAPAVANDGWLDRFMTLAAQNNYRVDFIALHFYVDFTDPAAVAGIMKVVDGVYAKYRKPIWITEIGAIDIRPWGLPMRVAPGTQLAIAFMKQAIAAFAQDDAVVERYAWFTDYASKQQDSTSSLYDASGELTSIGRAFASIR